MYRYDITDKTLVRQRVAQFRDQTQRFLKGALSEDEFKHLRLRNGLYIQRHAPPRWCMTSASTSCGTCVASWGLKSSPEADWGGRPSSARWCANSCRASICSRIWRQYCAFTIWKDAATI